MNVKSVEKEATRASVTVELTREELEPALNRAYLKYRKDIMIPGFRKGHAPRMVIEAAYGKHVFFEDAVEDMFPDIYKDAVLTQDIRPVGRPSVSKMDIADDGAVTLTIVTDLYPVAELGEYKNLEIEKAEVEVKGVRGRGRAGPHGPERCPHHHGRPPGTGGGHRRDRLRGL